MTAAVSRQKEELRYLTSQMYQKREITILLPYKKWQRDRFCNQRWRQGIKPYPSIFWNWQSQNSRTRVKIPIWSIKWAQVQQSLVDNLGHRGRDRIQRSQCKSDFSSKMVLRIEILLFTSLGEMWGDFQLTTHRYMTDFAHKGQVLYPAI